MCLSLCHGVNICVCVYHICVVCMFMEKCDESRTLTHAYLEMKHLLYYKWTLQSVYVVLLVNL